MGGSHRYYVEWGSQTWKRIQCICTCMWICVCVYEVLEESDFWLLPKRWRGRTDFWIWVWITCIDTFTNIVQMKCVHFSTYHFYTLKEVYKCSNKGAWEVGKRCRWNKDDRKLMVEARWGIWGFIILFYFIFETFCNKK